MVPCDFLWFSVGWASSSWCFFPPSTPRPPISSLSEIFGNYIPSNIGRRATVSEMLARRPSSGACPLHAYCLTRRVKIQMLLPWGANTRRAALARVAICPEGLRVVSNDGTFLTSNAALPT